MHPSDRTSDALAPALAPAPTSSGIATRSPSAHESTQCSRTRRPRCYLSMRSVTHATVSCLCAKAYLVGVLALETCWPGLMLFSARSPWRDAFGSLSVVAIAQLFSNVLLQFTLYAVGRRRPDALSLHGRMRGGAVVAFVWASCGLLATAAAAVLVFLGIHHQHRRASAVLRWSLALVVGMLSALAATVCALLCAAAAWRIAVCADLKRRRRFSRSHSRSRSGSNLQLSTLPIPTPPPTAAPPPPSTSPNSATGTTASALISRCEIESKLAALRRMGFHNNHRNYRFLFAANLAVDVAANRLRALSQ